LKPGGEFFMAPRVCGRYICDHLGWYTEAPGPIEEHLYYRENATKWASTIREAKREKYSPRLKFNRFTFKKNMKNSEKSNF
jgi:hypothetical protein